MSNSLGKPLAKGPDPTLFQLLNVSFIARAGRPNQARGQICYYKFPIAISYLG